MKKMLKTLFTATLMVLLTTTAFAQDKAAEGAKAVTANMKEQLKLNDSQYTKVLDINQAFLQKAISTKNSAATKVEKAKKLKTVSDERDTKLKSVLTEDQYKVYIANKAENRKKLRAYYADKDDAE